MKFELSPEDIAQIVALVTPKVVEALARVEREPSPVQLYGTVAQAAQLFGYSRRHVEGLVTQGLPMIGRGRARRVDIAAAKLWLAARKASK